MPVDFRPLRQLLIPSSLTGNDWCSILNIEWSTFDRSHSWRWPSCNRDRIANPNHQSWKTADEWIHLAELRSSVMMTRETMGVPNVSNKSCQLFLSKSKIHGIRGTWKSLAWLNKSTIYSFVDQWPICPRRCLHWKTRCPRLGDAYDICGGQGLLVDQNKYQTKLAQMGMR